jgi:hypothetical protein
MQTANPIKLINEKNAARRKPAAFFCLPPCQRGGVFANLQRDLPANCVAHCVPT